VASNLTAEVGIPCLQKACAVLDYERPQPCQLMRLEPVRFRKPNRVEPKLRNIIAVLDVHMRGSDPSKL
jgi:hypothetical protein